MKSLSIAKKFTLVTVLLTAVMLIVGYFVLNIYKNKLTEPLADYKKQPVI